MNISIKVNQNNIFQLGQGKYWENGTIKLFLRGETD